MKSRFAAPALLLVISSPALAESIVTYHGGNHRHGDYVVPTLTQAAAANIQQDTKFSAKVDGNVYAQPLYWEPKGSRRALVIVATESNHIYALDGANGATVWKQSLGSPASRNELPCGNIDPVGVTGTPVIDAASTTLYADALIDTQKGPRHKVYALSLSDGSVLTGWPLDIESAINKAGGTFSSLTQGERSALLLYAQRLYVNYAGNAGDCGSYRGTVVQIKPDNASLDAAWQTRANGGGIWAQGGLAGDGTYLFVTTGNTFGANNWSDGEAIIKLKAGLAHSSDTKDYFAPSNWKDLDNTDQDLGGTEALPIEIAVSGSKPARRVIAFGKDGNAYLVDRHDLGGVGGAIQVLPVANGAIRTAPSVYQTDATTMIAFTGPGSSHCSGGNITMLNIAASGSSPMSFALCAALSGGGAPILTTTDGSSDPIVWAVGAEGDNELHGFNALNGKAVFSGSGTRMNGLHHFQTLVATRDRLYVAADNTVYAFRWR